MKTTHQGAVGGAWIIKHLQHHFRCRLLLVSTSVLTLKCGTIKNNLWLGILLTWRVQCKYGILINTRSVRMMNPFTSRTLIDTLGHVYARSLRLLRTNPFGEKQEEKNCWSRRFSGSSANVNIGGRRWDSLSNAISDVITGIKTCRMVKRKLILHALPIWLLVPVPLRGLVDMLGICVCLCALFTHVLSQEAEEPITITVSERI